MNGLRIAVIGAGHLGSIHARLLKSVEGVDLVGVVDPVRESRERVANECGTDAFEHCDQLRAEISAAVVATPTRCHFEIADRLLRRGVHVLVEKPITASVAEADRLIAAARRHRRVLQVGHVERFNPAWNAVAPRVSGPRYIEAVRAGTYTFRSTDVSIVHDLMIHDLDLVLALADSPVVDVEAMGVNVFGPHADLAHAQLKLANGCIVNLNASRVSYQPQRTMRVFSPRACATIDFARNQATLVHPREDVLRRAVDLTACPTAQRRQIQDTLFQDLLRVENVEVEPINAILQQQREFVASILHGRPVRVTGQQGRNALAVAEQIQQSIRSHRWNGTAEGPVGPDAAGELARVAPSRAA